MTKETKYYTPGIEEFHVGCDYRILNRLSGTYENRILTRTEFIEILDEEENGFYDQRQMKYLDREDIESLGWKYRKLLDGRMEIFGYHLNSKVEDRNFSIRFIPDWDTVNIIVLRGGYRKYRSKVFIGFIKNKSELSKLMAQLGIKGNE